MMENQLSPAQLVPWVCSVLGPVLSLPSVLSGATHSLHLQLL